MRRAKLTGCLLIVTARVSLSGRLHEKAQQVSEVMSSASSNTEGAMNRRESNVASALHFRRSGEPQPRIIGADDAKGTVIEIAQKLK